MQFDKDMNSELAKLFLDVREFIMKNISLFRFEAKERYKDNLTSFYTDEFCNGFCYIKTKNDYIRIGWFKGAFIDDKFGLLVGDGKVLRGQNIKKFDATCKKAIMFYIKETHALLTENIEKKKLKKSLSN